MKISTRSYIDAANQYTIRANGHGNVTSDRKALVTCLYKPNGLLQPDRQRLRLGPTGSVWPALLTVSRPRTAPFTVTGLAIGPVSELNGITQESARLPAAAASGGESPAGLPRDAGRASGRAARRYMQTRGHR